MPDSSTPIQLFALVVPPGLEELSKKELKEKIQDAYRVSNEKTGLIEIEAKTTVMLKASLLLKIPTRILLRIDSFKVRDFPKLFKKISKINWSNWYVATPELIKVNTSKSRLIHSDRIEETIRDGIGKFFKGSPPKEKQKEKALDFPMACLHANLVDDQMQLSLDISGTELYTRGRTHIGKAPLRENLAAAFYYFSNIDKDSVILDPMAGSGTLLTESLRFNQPEIVKKQAWEAFKVFTEIEKIKLVDLDKKSTHKVYANEWDKNTFSALKNNLPSEEQIELTNYDAFKLEISDDIQVILSNPPWDERVEIKEGKKAFYTKLLNKFKKQKICLILPQENQLPKKVLDKARVLKLKSGGFPILYACWEPDL